MEIVLAYIYLLLLIVPIIKALRNRDLSQVFSPLVFFSVYYGYYILVPYFTSETDIYGGNRMDGVGLLLLAAIINYSGLLIGFNQFKPTKVFKSNNLYNNHNAFYLGICFLIIGAISYFSVNGFKINLVSLQTEYYDATEHRFGHTEQYVTMLVSLLPAAACLFYARREKWIYLVFTIVVATIIGVMGGSRYRLFLFFIPLVVFYHLYPTPKRINYKVWIPTALLFILFMGVIEHTRNYGSGLDLERITEILEGNESMTKASEAELVYSFSAKVMKAYRNEPIIPVEVFGTALCLPIPRSLFPGKPDAQYLRDANIKTLGTDTYGAAYLNIVEWYLALGWIGVFLNGIILGLLSRLFWNNYKMAPGTIGAVLNLSMFNGVCYVFVSRGYLAQEFLMFMYYVPIVGWIARILLKVNSKVS